ncbi:hypothetical protein B5X24_HaOG205299 [Helicoverpa armigera]|uniref:Uncharacterized protein n=1 Tax=Helicoverpa armigera TaxID=29058 RepID=A0A2W1BM07_HELAM|nr:hypothetical protein B5X24_HaOG205299 [Helicoverpa armigera]
MVLINWLGICGDKNASARVISWSLAFVSPGVRTSIIIHLRVYKEALAAGMEPLSENGLCLSELELHGGGHLHESVAASVGSAISSLMAPLHHEPQHTPLHHAPPLHHEPLEKLKCKLFCMP